MLLAVQRQLADKVSVGEYNRRHKDLEEHLTGFIERNETRIRAIERWQDHANGRYHSSEGERYG